MTALNPYSAPASAGTPPAPSSINLDFRQIALVNVYLYGLVFFISFLHMVSLCPSYIALLNRSISGARDTARFWWYLGRVAIYLLASSQITQHAGRIVDGMLAQARATVPDHLAHDARSADLHAVLVMFIRLTALSYIVLILDELTYATSYAGSFENMLHFGPLSVDAACYLFRILINSVTVVVFYRLAPGIAGMFSRQRVDQAARTEGSPARSD